MSWQMRGLALTVLAIGFAAITWQSTSPWLPGIATLAIQVGAIYCFLKSPGGEV